LARIALFSPSAFQTLTFYRPLRAVTTIHLPPPSTTLPFMLLSILLQRHLSPPAFNLTIFSIEGVSSPPNHRRPPFFVYYKIFPHRHTKEVLPFLFFPGPATDITFFLPIISRNVLVPRKVIRKIVPSAALLRLKINSPLPR